MREGLYQELQDEQRDREIKRNHFIEQNQKLAFDREMQRHTEENKWQNEKPDAFPYTHGEAI